MPKTSAFETGDLETLYEETGYTGTITSTPSKTPDTYETWIPTKTSTGTFTPASQIILMMNPDTDPELVELIRQGLSAQIAEAQQLLDQSSASYPGLISPLECVVDYARGEYGPGHENFSDAEHLLRIREGMGDNFVNTISMACLNEFASELNDQVPYRHYTDQEVNSLMTTLQTIQEQRAQERKCVSVNVLKILGWTAAGMVGGYVVKKIIS